MSLNHKSTGSEDTLKPSTSPSVKRTMLYYLINKMSCVEFQEFVFVFFFVAHELDLLECFLTFL